MDNKLRDRAAENHAALYSSTSVAPSIPSYNAVRDVAAEVQVVQDRLHRSLNLILYNVSTEEGVSDADKVKKCLAKISNINTDSIIVTRFSKPTMRSDFPPILMRFNSSYDVTRILKNSRLLPKDVEITADHTPTQRNQYKHLKKIATEHNAANTLNQKVVKLINGTPTLIDKKPLTDSRNPDNELNNANILNSNITFRTTRNKKESSSLLSECSLDRPKLSYIKMNLHQFSIQPHIIVITKTWLQPNIHSSELGLTDYLVYRHGNLLDFNVSSGGGVLVAIKKGIAAQRISVKSSFQQVFIKIDCASTKIILCAAYFQPNSKIDLYSDHMHAVEYITNKNADHQFIFVGDYNLPHIVWKTDPLHYQQKSYVDPIHRFYADNICAPYSLLNLEQFYPLHPNKGYSLDLLFANAGAISPLDLQEELVRLDSHHQVYFFDINLPKEPSVLNISPKRNFLAADYDAILSDLMNCKLGLILVS